MTLPLTPPDCDLQDFPFMPLHVARLRDSDLAGEAHPEEFMYAVLLWCASWHQIPAGSVPENDAVLTKLCGLGRDVRAFRKRRDGALRGFIRCDDGRLYHPVVAEQAIEAWRGKIEQRHRTECARVKKHNQRHEAEPANLLSAPTFDQFMSTHFPDSVPYLSPGTSADVPRETPSKGKRQGQGEGQGYNNTDADASGGEPPLDPVKVLFDGGIRLLGAAGIEPKQARSIIGKWRRDYPDEGIIVALGAAQREGAIDPVSFITKALETRHGDALRERGQAGRRSGNGFLNALNELADRQAANHDADDGIGVFGVAGMG